ncbi:RidA family protein [Flavobacteriaceae bacterium AH-315-B10]|nr:RidA family protein [Flavobacteriaceae bacterium AH-315-B10]
MKRTILLLSIILLSCNTEKKETITNNNLYDYDIEERLDSLGITLHEPTLPKHIKILLATKVNNLLYLSGSGPTKADGSRVTGKVGTDLTVEEGYEAAKLVAIRHLSVLKKELGDLNKVVRIVKVLGMVNADSSFTQHPKVINGYSETMVAVFGERGMHARSAVGMVSLPWNIACEVEAIVQIQE